MGYWKRYRCSERWLEMKTGICRRRTREAEVILLMPHQLFNKSTHLLNHWIIVFLHHVPNYLNVLVAAQADCRFSGI